MRPREVTTAVTLLYIAWGIEFLLLVIGGAGIDYFGIALLGLIVIFMMSCGKNWARILFLVLFVLSLVLTLSDARLSLFYVLGLALYISGAALLLTPTARDWFKLGL